MEKEKIVWAPEQHKIVTARMVQYPFTPYWMCVCSVPMPDVPFGIPLERAFRKHLEEVNARHDS